jgi:carboxylate-amine ligase
VPATPARTELLRLASWRAGHSGLDGDLIDPTGRPAPAEQVIRALVNHVRPVLDEYGDLKIVDDLVTTVLGRGNGAIAQRRIFRTSCQLADVVGHAVDRTIS